MENIIISIDVKFEELSLEIYWQFHKLLDSELNKELDAQLYRGSFNKLYFQLCRGVDFGLKNQMEDMIKNQKK